jgi:hypothetical protein
MYALATLSPGDPYVRLSARLPSFIVLNYTIFFSRSVRNELLPRILCCMPMSLQGVTLCKHQRGRNHGSKKKKSLRALPKLLLRVLASELLETLSLMGTDDFHRDDIDDFGRTSVNPIIFAQLRSEYQSDSMKHVIDVLSILLAGTVVQSNWSSGSSLYHPNHVLPTGITCHNSQFKLSQQ